LAQRKFSLYQHAIQTYEELLGLADELDCVHDSLSRASAAELHNLAGVCGDLPGIYNGIVPLGVVISAELGTDYHDVFQEGVRDFLTGDFGEIGLLCARKAAADEYHRHESHDD